MFEMHIKKNHDVVTSHVNVHSSKFKMCCGRTRSGKQS